MSNIFPELDGWDEIIHTRLTDKNMLSSTQAMQKLVISLANLRSVISAQLGYLQNKLERLNENIKKADESSTKLAEALNRLTLWGVIVASTGIFLAIIQFFYENKIWPFSQ